MNRKIIYSSVLIILIVILACIVRTRQVNNSGLMNDPKAMRTALYMEKNGGIPANDYLKWRSLYNDVHAGKAWNDNDFNWLISQLHDTSNPIMHAKVMCAIAEDKHMTSKQRDIVFNEAVKCLSNPDKLDKKYACCIILEVVPRPEAIAYLNPLLNDPDPSVRRIVHRTIEKLHK